MTRPIEHLEWQLANRGTWEVSPEALAYAVCRHRRISWANASYDEQTILIQQMLRAGWIIPRKGIDWRLIDWSHGELPEQIGGPITLRDLYLASDSSRPITALRRWANDRGYEGREGGWIYKDGKPFTQGWRSFIHNVGYEALLCPGVLNAAYRNRQRKLAAASTS